MAWTAPRTWVTGEIVTAAIMNTHVKDQLRYLKGLDGVPTVESGLTIDNTDGDERLLLPLLSTAECTTVLNAEGEFAFDETLHKTKFYDGTAIRRIISSGDNTYQFFVPCLHGSGGALTTNPYFMAGYNMNSAGDYGLMSWRVPQDFVSLTAIKAMILSIGTGTFNWSAQNWWGADGEAWNANNDSTTGADRPGTNVELDDIDISAAFTGIAANDIVSSYFELVSFATLTNIILLGLDVKYTI